ncbi:hypothetical protein [Lactiplantibacillus pingfangensis]|nr:hypothetical protein [Lactiplantibacillus pingfangensis]
MKKGWAIGIVLLASLTLVAKKKKAAALSQNKAMAKSNRMAR